MDAVSGLRVTVMGLGTRGGGPGVARFLAESGAVVTVTDMRSADDLAEPLAGLADLPIRFVLGRHDERDFSLDGADMVVRNPGVRRSSPLLRLARSQGVPVEMEMSLFLRDCPAPAIGITGTKGKTSTAMLCGAMLRAWDPTTVIAGNMGVTALGQLRSIAPDTPVVLELSSWQVEATAEHRLGPHIAVLTNISEDHLDAYDGFADYAATKRSICVGQSADDFLVVNADDPEAWRAADETQARVVPFGLGDRGSDGAWVEGRVLVWRRDGRVDRIGIPDRDPLAGDHQARNIAAAAAAALLRGAPSTSVQAGLERFKG
ncbi:MAG: UDP-N-acetylmuramoyl-L-alanine--D-glutamate ligase, partial [Thermomicrobiales bacterium]